MSSRALAQDERESTSSFLKNVAKGVVLDPTTYVPAALSYDSTMRDWNTSQTFFQHGFLEQNARFTISGLPNDKAVSYGEGRSRIFRDAMTTLQVSVLNNLTSRVFEETLMERYPHHRKVVKTLGWIERTAFASSMAYILSNQHYRQWKSNEALATQMGY
jgi:hypothetical protein